jgi:hypothetical protein
MLEVVEEERNFQCGGNFRDYVAISMWNLRNSFKLCHFMTGTRSRQAVIVWDDSRKFSISD